MSTDGDNTCGEYSATRVDGVFRVTRPQTEWLSTGWNGGRWQSESAYNVSVPEGWTCTNLDTYVRERLESAGFVSEESVDHSFDDEVPDGGILESPVLLTGVNLEHARGARCGPVTVYATAGVSNPAALPMDPQGGSLPDDDIDTESDIGTTRALERGALANLLAVTAEAKAATLLSETGFPGTTTDAIVVGHDPTGAYAEFSGSATAVGAATRACVREALRASLQSRYDGTDATIPDTVETAAYGTSTDVRATVFRP